jgi:predicted transcriptional regulator
MSEISAPPSHGQILRMVTDVIASYLKKNPVSAAELPEVIGSVYAALSGKQIEPAEPVDQRPEPAVSIKRSVTPDYIVCLEDGKKLKMLKRHLATAYGMTPDEYRQRWNLPPDYPMVAPNYAAQRSNLAKQIGLGSRARVEEKPVPRGRGGRKGATA